MRRRQGGGVTREGRSENVLVVWWNGGSDGAAIASKVMRVQGPVLAGGFLDA